MPSLVRRQWRDRRGRWVDMPDLPGAVDALIGGDDLDLPPLTGRERLDAALDYFQDRGVKIRGPAAPGAGDGALKRRDGSMARYSVFDTNTLIPFSQWDPGAMATMLEVIRGATERYPEILDADLMYLREIQATSNEGTPPQIRQALPPHAPAAVAVARGREGQMLVFNDQYPLPDLAKGHVDGHLLEQTSSVEGIMWHEVGHMIAWAYGVDDMTVPIPERQRRFQDVLDRFGIGFDDVASLGNYAASSPVEAFAELSALVHVGATGDHEEVARKAEEMFRAITSGELALHPGLHVFGAPEGEEVVFA